MAEELRLFATVASAIVLEAAPYVLLGSLIAGLVDVFASPERLARRLPKSPLGQILAGLAGGFVIPTCECGVVPIVRGLMRKGVPARTAITYMLAAPSINPIVLLSTWAAFRMDESMVLWRVALSIPPALALGLAVGGVASAALLRAGAQKSLDESDCGCVGGCCGHGHSGSSSKLVRVLTSAASEFLDMGAFLIVGACAAAAVKTFLPFSVLEAFSGSTLLAVPAMMGMAIVLSICSEADAFVAASFAGFPPMSLAAFMAVGPMVDLKMGAMYLAVFRRRLALALMVVPVVVIGLMAVTIGLMGGG
jgi:uncharacterized membrane protein YraQ (UPF0718 family)